MENSQLINYLKQEGYEAFKEIPGKGLCGVQKYAFTYGLVYGLNTIGYEGRYCFASKFSALAALQIWDGQGDPPGLWIKHKGNGIDKTNPLFNDEYEIKDNTRSFAARQ